MLVDGRRKLTAHYIIKPRCRHGDCMEIRDPKAQYCKFHEPLHRIQSPAVVENGIRQITDEEKKAGRAFPRRRHLIHLEPNV